MRLAQRLGGRRARGAGAARRRRRGCPCSPSCPRTRTRASSLAGQAARVGGHLRAARRRRARARGACRSTARARSPRSASLGVAALAGWQQLERRSRPRRPWLTEYPAERRLATTPASRRTSRARASPAPRPPRTRSPSAVDPIRVFVGLHAAPTVEERARLAVDELERLGAFERRRILVCSPTLRGYVNPIPVARRGAPVRRRRRLGRRPVPRQAHAADAGEGADRRAHAPRAARGAAPARCRPAGRGLRLRREPRRVGEPERVPRAAACARSTRRGVRARAVDRHAVLLAPAAAARAAARSRPTRASARSARASCSRASRRDPAWRFVFLERRTDPVVLFSGLDLIWRRPDWLPPGRWTPGVTFVQLAFDLVAATNWTVDGAAGARARLPAGGPAGGRPRVRPRRRARARSPRWPTGSWPRRSHAARDCARCGADPAILRAIEYAFPDCATPRLTARRTPIS